MNTGESHFNKTENALKQKLHNTLVGRDKELEAIKIQLDKVFEGQSAWTVLAGDVGVGKTVLLKTAPGFYIEKPSATLCS